MNTASPEAPPNRMRPTALTVADAARLLSAAGGRPVTPEMLHADLAAGAPVNADGTINLVHYAAWLIHQAAGVGLQAAGWREETDDVARGLTPEARSQRGGDGHV